MDQLKKVLAGAAKHQFWIITGMAALLACVAWYMTSSSLKKQYEDSAKAIDEKFKAMTAVSSAIATHPNDHSKTEMSKIIDGLATDVETAWGLQYKRQEQYLQWREDAIKLPLLIDKLKRLYPIELKATYPDEPKNPTISNEEKRRFSLYFAEQMPELAKIIGVTWVGEASSTAGGSMGMPGGPGGGDGYGNEEGSAGGYGNMSGGMGGMTGAMSGNPSDVVIWPKASQSQLLTSLKMWKGDQPTVYQMMYTQENMWILEGIFKIIANTNLVPQTGKAATANFQATIKEIEYIRIGREAVANAGSIAGSAPSGGGMEGSMGSSGMMGSGGSSMVGGGDTEGSEGSGGSFGGGEGSIPGGAVMTFDPADKRYVDATYKPITGDELRSKITTQSPDDAYFAVAKRIPVRLKFKIDFSQLQRFLANCGNEGLMLEVRQVRVGKFQDATAAGGLGGFGGMGPGSAPGMPGLGGGAGGSSGMDGGDMFGGESGGEGGMGSESGMMGPGGMGMGMGTSMKKPDELSVEVYGVVYLFNPANIESLGLSKVTEDTQIKDTVSTPVEEPVVPVNPNNTTPADAANSGTNTPEGTVPADAAPSSAVPPANDPAGTVPPGTVPAVPDNGVPPAEAGSGAASPAGN